MSSLMLSCGDSNREDRSRPEDRKGRMYKKNKASDQKDEKDALKGKNVQTQPVPSNKEAGEEPVEEDLAQEELQEELLVEQPFDSDEDEEVVVSDTDEVDEESAVSEEESDMSSDKEKETKSSESEEELAEEENGEFLEEKEADEWPEASFISTEEERFSITHAGEEGDGFVVQYKSQEIILDTPGACVRLRGIHFDDLRIEDGTGFFPVICGTSSICEPGNYNLINDSIPLIWDDYGMEPSEYNDSSNCQELSLLAE